MIENGLMKGPLKVGGIDDRRNFTHVRDIVEAYWISTEICNPGELYLVGSENDNSIFTFKEALEKLIKISGTLGDYGLLMRKRLLEITMDGLPENWDGVYEAKTK